MSRFKIFLEFLEIAFGVGLIAFALVWDVLDAWIAVIGVGLVCWAVYNISKELRDSSEESEVSAMAIERDRIMQGE